MAPPINHPKTEGGCGEALVRFGFALVAAAGVMLLVAALSGEDWAWEILGSVIPVLGVALGWLWTRMTGRGKKPGEEALEDSDEAGQKGGGLTGPARRAWEQRRAQRRASVPATESQSESSKDG